MSTNYCNICPKRKSCDKTAIDMDYYTIIIKYGRTREHLKCYTINNQIQI